MKRILSGAMSPEFPAPPRFFQRDASGSGPTSPKGVRSRSSSISKIFGGESTPKEAPVLPQETSATGTVSPELVPIVTLLSAHAHRRYHEGVFLILQDLKGDGTPAARKWQEVYGVLIGTQLALWDAKELAQCESGMDKLRLKDVASKPQYINFTDATLRTLNGSDAVVMESKKRLQNALVVSTTLKNRYFLQFSDKESFNHWHAAIRLSLFECISLQEAYTGAFLSSRGAKLGDIKIILSDSKFNYEDWVSVRFGAGMPWKRCFAVISQATSKKNPYGKISFFENDKKTKKANVMATVVSSEALYAVYPSSPMLIDTSTIIKLDGSIVFNKKEDPQETSIFIMPEKHQAVPGYDTIIRFLVPAMNAFKLYGRPKKLIANKDDQKSLLFALPTLPHVHYLKVEELLPLTNSVSSLQWSSNDWRNHIREILQKKIGQGYTGCGSSSGLSGALASPVIGSSELFESSGNPASPTFLSLQKPLHGNSISSRSYNSESVSTLTSKSGSPSRRSNHLPTPSNINKGSTDSVSATSSYSVRSGDRFLSPQSSGLRINEEQEDTSLKVEIPNSNFNGLANDRVRKNKGNAVEKFSTASELSAIYDKYSASPFGKGVTNSPEPQTIDVDDRSPYEQYLGSTEAKTFEISNIRDSGSTTDTNARKSGSNYYPRDGQNYDQGTKGSEQFTDFAQRVSEMKIENGSPGKKVDNTRISPIDLDLNFDVAPNQGQGYDASADDNVFDPDFMEQNQMLESESVYNSGDGLPNNSDPCDPDPYEKIGEAAKQLKLPAVNVQYADNTPLPHSGQIRNFQQYTGQPAIAKAPNNYTNNHRQAPPQPADVNGQNLYQRQGYANSPNRQPAPARYSPQYSNFPNHGPNDNYARPTPPQMYQKQALQMQPQPRAYPQMYPQNHLRQQQQYPNPGGPYNNFQNGPPPPQQLNRMGASAPMKPQGGGAGPYSQAPSGPGGRQHKPRPAPNGGFSQFMPSTTTNPYSR